MEKFDRHQRISTIIFRSRPSFFGLSYELRMTNLYFFSGSFCLHFVPYGASPPNPLKELKLLT